MIRALPEAAHMVCARLQEAGHPTYVVGGAVRNLVLGRKPKDIDLATAATPGDVRKLFRRVIPTGEAHGTVTVLHNGWSFEVTTFRTEAGYTDRRRPDTVTFVGTIRDDLSRRDFTINGMALNPQSAEFLDPHGGENDLRAGVIRAIGDPQTRFSEDALRLLRAVRFAAELSFAIEQATWHALCDQSDGIRLIAVERVREELDRILACELPSTGFRLMQKSGLLARVLPELDAGVGVEQRGVHRFDVFEHSIISCDAAPADNRIVRLAALLHDVGKPPTLQVDASGERTFHGHDAASAELAEQALRRLRYPNAVIQEVVHLIRQHMFHYTPEWTDSAVRRFLARVGLEHVENLFELRAADSYAQQGVGTENRALDQLRTRIAEIEREQHAITRNDLAVNGHELAGAGIPRGPVMGVVIDHLLETVLDDPSQNSRERLLQIARQFYESRIREE